MFGASREVLQEPGSLQVGIAFRTLHSDNHYNGTVPQYQRQENVNYVVNNQHIMDLYGTYAVTRRLSFSASVPFVDASWSIPTPVNPAGERREQNANGVGDISVLGRYWMLNPARHTRGNFSVGLGVKAPTGDYDQRDSYPDLLTGANNNLKVVDQSIQPGDGGWGILLDLQGYKQVSKLTFFGSGVYLANPRDTNNAPSILVGGGLGANPAFSNLLTNSVPDSYLLRAGTAFALKGPVSATLALRMEGLPRYDIIGDSNGFRRPGYETFFEPGVVLSFGRSTININVPYALVRNRQHNAYTGAEGDATFPDYIVLAGYSYTFGPVASPTCCASP